MPLRKGYRRSIDILNLPVGNSTKRPIPLPLFPLIGRQQELASIDALLRQSNLRLLTLTGPPGVGKTRISLEIAATFTAQSSLTTYFVPLNAVENRPQLISAILHGMEQGDAGNQDPEEQLLSHLRDKELFLILDNFEHLLDETQIITAILNSAPQVKLLVTSRTRLHLYGEHELRVPPLAFPTLSPTEDLDTFLASPAVALFVARAQTVMPDFDLSLANAAVVAEICRQLDGLPLAIELAATRSKLLPPPALLARLSNTKHSRLNTLTAGARDLPKRQQTLRSAIDWSYHLLPFAARLLFQRLSVFVNGWTLEAAEVICDSHRDGLAANEHSSHESTGDEAAQSISVFDGLALLFDHSLLVQTADTEGNVRFHMLETIREFAVEQAAADQTGTRTRERHAAYYCILAEAAEANLSGAQQDEWLARLEREHDNLRAALKQCQSTGDYERFLRLASSLAQFWWRRGYIHEGRQWFQAILAARANILAPTDEGNAGDIHASRQALFAKALYQAGLLAWYQGDYAETIKLGTESYALFRQFNNIEGMAWALRYQSLATMDQGDYVETRRLLAASLELFRQLNDESGIGWTLNNLGNTARYLGEYDDAVPLLEESLAIFQRLGDSEGILYIQRNLGVVAALQGELQRAHQLLTSGLALARTLNHRGAIALILHSFGRLLVRQGEYQQAYHYLREGLTVETESGNRQGMADCLDGLALLAAALQQTVCGAFLWQAASDLHREAGISLPPVDQKEQDGYLQMLEMSVGADGWQRAQLEAQTLTLADVLVALANHLQASPDSADSTSKQATGDVVPVSSEFLDSTLPPTSPVDLNLTDRELDVLQLLARGLTYAQIAEALIVSPRTVDAHLRSIYGKLDVHSRHEATQLATQYNLI